MRRTTTSHRGARTAAAALAALAFLLAACGSDDGAGDADGDEGATATTEGTTHSAEPTGDIVAVPEDHETIQAAVDAASPGDLVMISQGVYEEAVDVETDNLTIRGVDRNEVILDGGFEMDNGIRVVGANGVAVENMTARNYTSNGFYWTGVEGFRGSYLTSYRTGDYGIYAFDSTKGQFEHSYASGSRDAGFYIGQCYPCEVVITDVISEHNGLGYSGTNSGGDLFIVNSTWRNNRAGIVPNTGSYQLCYPGRESTIVGNTIHDNQQPDTPAIDVALLAMGNGILVAGSVNNTIERNLVFDHERTGIGLVPFPEEDATDVPPDDDAALERACEETRDDALPDPDDVPGLVLWPPRGNQVTGNVVSGSGLADLAVGTIEEELSDLGNCFSDNEFTSTAPTDLEQLAPCDADADTDGDWEAGALDLVELIAAERPPSGDWETTPVPPDQPAMPDAETAPARPATDVPMDVDPANIEVPEAP